MYNFAANNKYSEIPVSKTDLKILKIRASDLEQWDSKE